MKQILDVWKNVNGWHWRIETRTYHVDSAISMPSKAAALAQAKRIAKRLGVRIDATEVSE